MSHTEVLRGPSQNLTKGIRPSFLTTLRVAVSIIVWLSAIPHYCGYRPLVAKCGWPGFGLQGPSCNCLLPEKRLLPAYSRPDGGFVRSSWGCGGRSTAPRWSLPGGKCKLPPKHPRLWWRRRSYVGIQSGSSPPPSETNTTIVRMAGVTPGPPAGV